MSRINREFTNYIANATFPPLVHRGVLRLKGKDSEGRATYEPIYLVEMLEVEGVKELVTVFKPHPDSSIEKPIRDYTLRTVEKTYSKKTRLGKLASTLNSDSKGNIILEKPPLFMAMIEQGVDTFSGKAELGFKEKEPDTTTIDKGKLVTIHGGDTGVFIGLSSIKWNETVVATEELLRKIRSRQEVLSYGFGGL